MESKQRELLETMGLKTIETMIEEKNINLLAFISECHKRDFFFPEFYEITYVKMLTQYPFEKAVEIACAYKNFGLDSTKASELFNDSAKYVHYTLFQAVFTHSNAVSLMTWLNERELYLSDDNMKKIPHAFSGVSTERKEEIIEANEKVKAYHSLNGQLEKKSDGPRKKI